VAVTAAAMVLCAGALGACGDDDDGATTSAATTTAGSPAVSDVQRRSADAGTKAGEDAGEPQQAPADKKVGFLQIVQGIESADRVALQIEKASKALGWDYVLCDAAGDPAKMAACGTSLLSQDVDVIFTTIGDASTIASAMRTARKRDIPVIDVSGEAQGFDANYAPDDKTIGDLLADDLAKRLDPLKDEKVKIAVSAFPQPFAQKRTASLESLVADNDHLEIAATASVDPTNVIEGSKKSATDQLTQNPDLKAFWIDFDTAGQAIGQLVRSRYAGKEFPDRPLVATFHADHGTVKLMRSGAIDVVADVAYDASSWVGVDQLLQHWTRDAPLSQERAPEYPGAGDLYTYQIIDGDNLPADGEYATPEIDAEAYFMAKWKAEFGL